MIDNKIIELGKQYVKSLFENEYSGHDYWHTIRVYKVSNYIAKIEGADEFIVSLASLLHDVDDVKLSPETHEEKKRAVSFMKSCNLEENTINRVCKIIDEISYGNNDERPSSIEAKCVQDADRLDAIGAIGIGRVFAYGGNHNRLMYDPEVKPKLNMTKEEYRNSKSTTINHFYEKLFKLKDLINTDTGKRIASERERFMKNFVDEFMKEWNVEI